MKKRSPFPWWASALLAIISYYLLKYLIPQFFPGSIGGFTPKIAPLVAMAFLLHSGALLYEGDTKSDDFEDEWDEDSNEELENLDNKKSCDK